MTAVCPQGHTSQTEDYCDVCGSPIEAGSSSPAAAPAVPEPSTPTEPITCPHCGSAAAPQALFCENCGYDFTTGTAPQPEAEARADHAPRSGPEPDSNPLSLDGPAPEADTGAEADPEVAAEPEAAEPGVGEEGGLPTPPVPGDESWVVEVWVDPDWYNAQKPEDPMPSPGSPRVVPLRTRSVLVGRPSASRGIRPQVDAESDTGVSRRQCQLTTDGHRWWVEDLDSANGTYVSPAGEPLPRNPLEVGVRHELADGERILVGGWTRLVIRRALPGEV